MFLRKKSAHPCAITTKTVEKKEEKKSNHYGC